MRDSVYVPCDACGASDSMYLVKLVDGELSFCGHHYNQYKDGLDKVSYEVIELHKEEPQLVEAEI